MLSIQTLLHSMRRCDVMTIHAEMIPWREHLKRCRLEDENDEVNE